MDKGISKFKIGDKVKVLCSRGNEFPLRSVYGATIIAKGFGVKPLYKCWQYQVRYDDGELSFGWLLEELIKFPNEQFEVEVL